MKKTPIITILLFLFLLNSKLYPVEFDELDKPPEGAHRGQMLLGAFVSIGMPGGDIIDAEHDFLEDSTYTFENETTKKIEVSHLAFSFGISFEYMPFDYIGAKTKFRRTVIVQKSNFGPEYENWNGYLLRDYALYIGPTFHTTNRRSWDFTLTPLVGYLYGRFTATPVGKKIITGYTGNTTKTVKGLSFGSEINFTAYFSGGLFLSMGLEWIRSIVDFDGAYNLTNPQTNEKYFEGKSSGYINTYSLIITSGFAFSN